MIYEEGKHRVGKGKTPSAKKNSNSQSGTLCGLVSVMGAEVWKDSSRAASTKIIHTQKKLFHDKFKFKFKN